MARWAFSVDGALPDGNHVVEPDVGRRSGLECRDVDSQPVAEGQQAVEREHHHPAFGSPDDASPVGEGI
jgi:hypothetical protein